MGKGEDRATLLSCARRAVAGTGASHRQPTCPAGAFSDWTTDYAKLRFERFNIAVAAMEMLSRGLPASAPRSSCIKPRISFRPSLMVSRAGAFTLDCFIWWGVYSWKWTFRYSVLRMSRCIWLSLGKHSRILALAATNSRSPPLPDGLLQRLLLSFTQALTRCIDPNA
jgi:hypothetical protein